MKKIHDLDGDRWSEVPPEQAEEWDDFYRAVAAQLFGHAVTKAAAVVSLDGQDWMLSLELHPIGLVN